MADFLSCMENHLPKEEVEEGLTRVEILAPEVKAMLDNADTPILGREQKWGLTHPLQGLV